MHSLHESLDLRDTVLEQFFVLFTYVVGAGLLLVELGSGVYRFCTIIDILN